jgi:hypothetical protein
MRTAATYLLLIALLQLLPSCQRTMGKTELLGYLNDPENKLVLTDSAPGFIYKVYFKPSDLIAAQHLVKRDSTIRLDSLRKAHKEYLYFNLCVSYEGKDLFSQHIPEANFTELQKRVSFGLEQYVILSDEQYHSYKLVDYSYPRLYGMTNSTNILLVFKNDAPEMADDYRLTIKDFITESSDQFIFTFHKTDIVKAPQLNFDLIL